MKEIPTYVKKNLEWYLEHELEKPEIYGQIIYDISMRYGI